MFWLTAILGIVVGGISALSVYQNITFASRNGGKLPPYIIAVTLLSAVCTFLLFFSANLWRTGRVRGAFVSFVTSVMLFFGGPPLLLTLLI